MTCPVCDAAWKRMGVPRDDPEYIPGWIPAGPLPPLTGFDCTACGGTGQARWYDLPAYQSDPK